MKLTQSGCGIAVRAMAVAATVFLAGCDRLAQSVIDEVNKRYPPVSSVDVRLAQAQVTSDALESRASWDAYAFLPKADVEAAIETHLRQATPPKDTTFGQIKVTLGDMEIRVAAKAEGKVTNLKLDYKADVEIVASPAVANASMTFKFAFARLQLTSLTIGEKGHDASVIAGVLNKAFDVFADNISSQVPALQTKLAIAPLQPVDPASFASKNSKVTGTKVNFAPVRLGTGAVIVSGTGLELLADLLVGNESGPIDVCTPARCNVPALQECKNLSPLPGVVIHHPACEFGREVDKLKINAIQAACSRENAERAHKCAAERAAWKARADALLAEQDKEKRLNLIKKQIADKVAALRKDQFGTEGAPAGAEIAVEKGTVVDLINRAFRTLDWKFGITIPEQTASMNQELRLYKMPDFICKKKVDNRDCTPHTCASKRDDRECSRCVSFLGGSVCGQDPVCNAAKEVQNRLYQAEHNLCQADAARLRATCETAKAAQQVLNEAEMRHCELSKMALVALGDGLTRVGRMTGTVKAAAEVSVTIKSIQVLDVFRSLAIETQVEARAPIRATLSFIPSNSGHLLCTFPFHDKPVHATAKLGPSQMQLSGVITTNDQQQVTLVTDRVEKVKFTVTPSPAAALFTQNPDLIVNCAGLLGLASLGKAFDAFQEKDLPPTVTGNFEEDVPSQTIPVSLGEVTISLPSRDIALKGFVGAKSFLYRQL